MRTGPIEMIEPDDEHENMGEDRRISLSELRDAIVATHYFTAADGVLGEWQMRRDTEGGETAPMAQVAPCMGRVTFCVLVLRGDFTVTGSSVCTRWQDFNAGKGRELARDEAINEALTLLAFEKARRIEARRMGRAG